MNDRFQTDCLLLLKGRYEVGDISRRGLLKGLALLLGAPALATLPEDAQAAAGGLIYVNWGGDAIKSMEQAFGQAFLAETGIRVRYDGSGPTEGAIAAQAKSGRPSWDMVDTDPFSAETLGKQGLLTPIDYGIVDRSKIQPGFIYEYAACAYFYSFVIAYSKKAYPTPPTGMADFFDVTRFPGKRALHKWGSGMWEAALLADGVKPQDLYPLDLKRAEDKLAAFKPHVAAFWGGGADSQALLLNGDATMAIIWSTRASVLYRDTNGDIDFIWDQGLIGPGSIAVLKNNPGGASEAMRYIAFSQAPERQKALFEMLGNGPANPATNALISERDTRFNCTAPANFAKQIPLDMSWYEKNYTQALDRYLKMISA